MKSYYISLGRYKMSLLVPPYYDVTCFLDIYSKLFPRKS